MLDLFTGQLFLTCFIAWVVSDVIKYLIAIFSKKTTRAPHQVFDSGGFPSSHTTIVTTLFFSLGISQGWTAPITTLAGVLAIIVIYDALNIRFQSGLHAKALNKLGAINPLTGKAFKENLGHTYLEVLGGLILGAMFAIVSYLVIK